MNADVAVPGDRETRVRQALQAAIEALKLARREAEGAQDDPARRRWLALGIVSALQGVMVAALSGYDTASIDAVLNPSQPDRIAPVGLLLRRARSAEYLVAPEQVELTGSGERALERLIAVRNAAVHALRSEVPDSFAADCLVAAQLIRHLASGAPAFDAAVAGVLTPLLNDELRGLERALRAL
jgi:hypothetical protein